MWFDYLLGMAPIKGWDTSDSKWTASSWTDVLEAKKIMKCKDLSPCDKG